MAPFVGRQAELAVMQARLTEALAGRPQTMQIQGPAGIGKTALLEHFLHDSGAEPAPIVLSASGEERSSCWPTGSSISWCAPPTSLTRHRESPDRCLPRWTWCRGRWPIRSTTR